MRLHGRQLGAEFQQHHLLDTTGLQGGQLFPQAGEAGGRGLGREILHGLGLEGDHGGRQPQGTPLIEQAAENGAMAQVDAIEVTDGGDATPVDRPEIVEATDDAHGSRGKYGCVAGGRDYSLRLAPLGLFLAARSDPGTVAGGVDLVPLPGLEG